MCLTPLFFVFILRLVFIVEGNLPAPYYPIDDIAVNCGSVGNSSALDGREWTGDLGTEFGLSRKQAGNSMTSRAVHTSLSGDPVPYLTARASHSPFFYTFKLHPGPKFIRLHFNPASYIGFETSIDFFTVQAGPYKLLHNFSASLAAGAMGVISFSKEFCVSIEESQELTITIAPSQSGNMYAFVNGIEIISMPSGLYYTPEGEPGADVVGPHRYKFYIDNSTALEMVHRLNIGGSAISPIEDTGMFRRWSKDSDYLLEKNKIFQVYHATSMIKYTNIPTFSAPLKVYQTSWSTGSSYSKKSTTFTWKLPVDLGFRYLVRLHFCQHEPAKSTKISHREFGILVNNQIAEKNAEVTKWGGGYRIAVYKDYVTTMRGDKKDGKSDLLVAIFSKSGLIEGKLNGLEVFKLSNPDDSLAGSNPAFRPHSSSTWMPKLPAFGSLNAIATKLIIIITTLNIVVYIQRWFWEEKLGKKNIPLPSSSDEPCRRFSLTEINTATCNFDEALVIGMGGFAKVYKGVIDDGTRTVAIKRMSSRSQEGALEFWMEIQMICRLRHNHLVSLIGYCDDGTEMILVYEYMACGTLAEHLFKLGPDDRSNFVPLSWEQRLKICMGAARGLDYLHTGTHHGVIHRDVKTSNILLDENLIGKISDFGLSKVETMSQLLPKSYVSTNIKGTVGYLDPDYFLSRKLSRKSDVYAFGVVLFEVLCGRPAVDPGLEEEQRSLAIWVRQSIREGKLDQILDPHVRGEISPHCLKVFTELAEKCLENQPKRRPSMANIISGLEFAMEQQERSDWFIPEEPAYGGTLSYSPRSGEQYGMSPKSTMNASKRNLKLKRLKSWRWDLLWNGVKASKMDTFVSVSSSKTYEDCCRRFLLTEIQSATNDFDENLIVGTGDFSKVYKGYIDYGSKVVAVKRLKKVMTENWLKKTDWLSDFCKEIEMLSQLQNPHLVSLIGYCYHKFEMILVYEYMVNGSLRSHLYGNQSADPLTWKQRLRICIDAAQGLDFLHTGGGQTILHLDINPGNILLDDKWVAKVSDYGLSKIGPLNAVSDNLTTVLGNCLGYLDPEYMFANGTKPTEKSDVYSFGLVLLEVLCGRKIEDHMLQRDQVFLRSWVKSNIAKGTVHKTIDPSLKGKIAPECLKEFIKIAERCLADQSSERPSMTEVVKGLKFAVQQQEAAKPNYDSFISKNM